MNFLNKLPEWVRWIICLPASVICAGTGGWIVYSNAHYLGTYDFVLLAVHPAIIQGLFLFVLHTTLPRWKNGIVLSMIILRTIILMLFVREIIMMLLAYSGVIKGIDDPFQLVDAIWTRQLIGEIIVLAVSITLFRALRVASTSDERTLNDIP